MHSYCNIQKTIKNTWHFTFKIIFCWCELSKFYIYILVMKYLENCLDRFFVINTLRILIPYIALVISQSASAQPSDGEPGTGSEKRRTDVSASWMYRARSRSVNSKAAAKQNDPTFDCAFHELLRTIQWRRARDSSLQRIIRMTLLILSVSDQWAKFACSSRKIPVFHIYFSRQTCKFCKFYLDFKLVTSHVPQEFILYLIVGTLFKYKRLILRKWICNDIRMKGLNIMSEKI